MTYYLRASDAAQLVNLSVDALRKRVKNKLTTSPTIRQGKYSYYPVNLLRELIPDAPDPTTQEFTFYELVDSQLHAVASPEPDPTSDADPIRHDDAIDQQATANLDEMLDHDSNDLSSDDPSEDPVSDDEAIDHQATANLDEVLDDDSDEPSSGHPDELPVGEADDTVAAREATQAIATIADPPELEEFVPPAQSDTFDPVARRAILHALIPDFNAMREYLDYLQAPQRVQWWRWLRRRELAPPAWWRNR